jgi:hypothetical protein
MPTFEPGHTKQGGRQKGTPNRRTAQLKDAILAAAEAEGGEEGLTGYLRTLARDEPVAFAGLLGKVLPLTLTSDPEDRYQITEIRLVAPGYDAPSGLPA